MLLNWWQSSGLNYVNQLAPAAWYRYGTGITVAGSGVSQWNDQSGNSRHLLQSTDTNRPALQSDGSILFDGVDNFLKTNAFTLNQPCTYYFLARMVAWSLNNWWSDGNSAVSGGVQMTPATPQIRGATTGGSTLTTTDLAVGSYGVVSLVINGASSSIQVNNGGPSSGDMSTTNPGGFTLGCRADPTAYSNIQVKEVIIFSSAHDATQRAGVIRYLQIVGAL